MVRLQVTTDLKRLVDGAAGPIRTDDLTLTKRLLYRLSYSGDTLSTVLAQSLVSL